MGTVKRLRLSPPVSLNHAPEVHRKRSCNLHPPGVGEAITLKSLLLTPNQAGDVIVVGAQAARHAEPPPGVNVYDPVEPKPQLTHGPHLPQSLYRPWAGK